MSKEQFSLDELDIARYEPSPFGRPPKPILSYPITMKENFKLLYDGKTPLWTPQQFGETNMVLLMCDPENIARSPGNPPNRKDGWGVEWIFEESVGGAVEKPGPFMVTDVDIWEEQVESIPDPDSWDWEGAYEKAKETLDPEKLTLILLPSVLFERLIALMGFEESAVCLIDDEVEESVHRLLRKITDIQKRMAYYCKTVYHADIMNYQDDWGTQNAETFSVETARRMLLPYMKELCDYVHSLGMVWDHHCCGFVENMVPLFVEAGFDLWGGQPLNDKWKLKQLYGDKMIFTGHLELPPDASIEEQDARIKEFFETIGEDNRVVVDIGKTPPEGFATRVYEASRRNYDRLVAEGRAIL